MVVRLYENIVKIDQSLNTPLGQYNPDLNIWDVIMLPIFSNSNSNSSINRGLLLSVNYQHELIQ